jgi:anthranilate phosphoribosyltransferase
MNGERNPYESGCLLAGNPVGAGDASSLLSMPAILSALIERRELSAEVMDRVMEEVLAGHRGEGEVAALLVALRLKGETTVELAAAATALRRHMTRLETGRSGLLDTCGMGGDDKGTFNISTATAFVAAAVGIPVVKHGNRAVSSNSGSTDVLRALGVGGDGGDAWARRCLDQTGLAFCFAPHYHPALARLANLRRQLGVRTIFNLLGPLANPAGAEYQLLGVARPELLDPLAGALARLGTRHALVVCSTDGLDEVSLSATTLVREIRDQHVDAHLWSPGDFGLEGVKLEELRAESPEVSASMIRMLLAGQSGPPLRIVIANAAAALLAADRVATLREGAAQAQAAVSSGQAIRLLDRLVECSTEEA